MGRKMEESLRLVWLEAFLVVVEHGTYKKAAEQLNVNQSTITGYMNALHWWVNLQLFATKGPVTLTPEGEAFVHVARDVCKTLNRSRGPFPIAPRKVKSAKDIKINPAAQVTRIKTKLKRAI